MARLASMLTGRPILGLDDVPSKIRYDWAEDLDEIDTNGRTILTQCKRIDTIHQPAKLADVLLGFAPKLVWTPQARLAEVRLRLVCSDTFFLEEGTARLPNTSKTQVKAHFLGQITSPPSPTSDLALWQSEAKALGHDLLFDTLWQQTEVLYVSPRVVLGEPASPLLAAEQEAVSLLLRWKRLHPTKQAEAAATLRSLIHSNLVEFHPNSDDFIKLTNQPPRLLDAADVHAALFELGLEQWSKLPFQVVDRTFLERQAALPKRSYVARSPDWADVVHGQDEAVKFLERDQTTEFLTLVSEKVIAPLERGSDRRLHALFILGAPGAGKSTLVRRIASKLVEGGQVVVADPGLNVSALRTEDIDEFIQSLDRLSSGGRPVLLVLDDPFSAEPQWTELMSRLGRPIHRIGVLGASPTFLFDQYKHQLGRQVDYHHQILRSPSMHERKALAALHGRDPSTFVTKEQDFLVLAMEAAMGVSFAGVIERIWFALNSGSTVSPAVAPQQLHWPVRAFLVTCFFHRYGVLCPQPLLERALAEVDDPTPQDWTFRLKTLEMHEGWHIFRVTTHDQPLWEYVGRLVGTPHPRVAQEAWQQRPVPAFDVANWVVPASTKADTSAIVIAEVAIALLGQAPQEAKPFIEKLASEWNAAAKARRISTRNFHGLVASLAAAGFKTEARKFLPGLMAWLEARDGQSWMAVLLWHQIEDGVPQTFPSKEFDIINLIRIADFTAAPSRALRFQKIVASYPGAEREVFTKLLTTLETPLPWGVANFLWKHVLLKATPEDIVARLSQIDAWLEANPLKQWNRVPYLAFLRRLPPGFEHIWDHVLQKNVDWFRRDSGDDVIREEVAQILKNLLASAPHGKFPDFPQLLDAILVRTPGMIDKFLTTTAAAKSHHLPLQSIKWGVNFVRMNPRDPSIEKIINGIVSPYRRLWLYLDVVPDSQAVQATLKDVRDVIIAWEQSRGKARFLSLSRLFPSIQLRPKKKPHRRT